MELEKKKGKKHFVKSNENDNNKLYCIESKSRDVRLSGDSLHNDI